MLGKSINLKYFKNQVTTSIEQSLLGLISISFISFIVNFFLPLNEINNTVLIFLILLISLYSKVSIKKEDVILTIIVSIFVLFLIIFDNEYRPDAGLYHLPFIQIINESNTIIGLTNLHFRFGHTSIIQYLSAINYNFFTGKNGILIPAASLISFVTIYFFQDLKKFINNKERLTFAKFFSLIIVIYISYKINRYSEFGNDAPSHVMLFFIISKYLYSKDYSIENFNFFYLYSIFAFLNKVFFILIFFIPLIFFIKNLKNLKNLILNISHIIIVLWFIKNLLVSGCLIYPAKATCISNLDWTSMNLIEKVQIQSEAWSKGWPQNKNQDLDMESFNKNFNWVSAWLSNHFKFILKLISPYIIFIFIIFVFMHSKKKYEIIKVKDHHYLDTKFKLLTVLTISVLGIILFIMKFPLYRYGYSYFIVFLFLLLMFFFNRFDTKRTLLSFKVIFIFGVLIISTKQLVRIYKYYDTRNFVPNHIFISNKSFTNKYKKINLEKNFSIYISEDECFYGLSPCSNEINHIKKISYKKKLFFDQILYDK